TERKNQAPHASGGHAGHLPDGVVVGRSTGDDRGDEDDAHDDENRNRVDQSNDEELQSLAEVFAEVVPLRQRIRHGVDDVASAARQISIDEEDADDDGAGENEQA